MAIKRQQNWLGQQRVDVADLRSVESAVSNDFDILGGKVMSGRVPLVMRGLTISTTTAAGNSADSLQISVAGALLMHFGASESGTVFSVDDNQPAEVLSANNGKISGSFTAGSTNYIGMDLRRSADATTTDLKQFLDADSDTEIPKSVPTARTLQYQILISTIPFSVSANICPIAKVVTDSSNLVVAITDARPMMFRLAAGGDNPNALSSYAWRDSGRREGNVTFDPPTFSVDPFSKGDKDILSLKEWMDAIMSVLWEAKSGEFWYSPTARDGAKMMFGSPVFVATGDNFIWTGGSSTLQWQSLAMAFENSTGYYNVIQDGSAVIAADGMCLYVDLQRGTNGATIVPAVGSLISLGTPNIPGSRYIIAWRQNGLMHVRDKAYEVGRNFPIATTTTTGDVKLSRTATTPSTPIVISDEGGTIAPATISGTGTTGLVVAGGASSTAAGGPGISSTGGNAGGGNTNGGDGIAGVGGTSAGSGNDGAGVRGTGTNNGAGIVGQGGSSSGAGGVFIGGGSGVAIEAFGGASASYAIFAAANGSSNATGLTATGAGTGTGVEGFGTASNAKGGDFTAHGTGAGVRGTGGNTSSTYIEGVGGLFVGGTGGSGGQGSSGVYSTGGVQGPGGYFLGPAGGGGYGLIVDGSSDGTGNAVGLIVTGRGTGGSNIVGGTTASAALTVASSGSSTNTEYDGIVSTASGIGSGINATGGSWGSGGGPGGTFTGGFVSPGVIGIGGNGGSGGTFTGQGNGAKGLTATGGNTSNTSNHGVVANGGGSSSAVGILATGAATGTGVKGVGGSTSGFGGDFAGTGGVGDVQLHTNPSVTTGFQNVQNAKNVCKAWVKCHTDGSTTLVIDDGYNVASVTTDQGVKFTVNLATGITLSSGNNHSVSSVMNDQGDVWCQDLSNPTSSTAIRFRQVGHWSGSAYVAPSSPMAGSGLYFYVIIFGTQ